MPDGQAQEHRNYYTELVLYTNVEETNILIDITRVLAEEKIQVKGLNTRTADGKYIFNVGIEINDRQQLENAKVKLNNLPGIKDIERVNT